MQRVVPGGFRSHLTLALCTILHAFTHALGQILVPLYLLIVSDLKLGSVWKASIIVTIYGLVYCISSYGAGVLADRFNRKTLLGVGLIGNALAVIAMGLTRQYEMLILLAVIAGAFGTIFHPCANALVPAHYPKSPGMAIGLLGMGSGLGFFFGPQYAGWRAQDATWHFGLIADWQRPCIEMGIFGLITGILFLLLAREALHIPPIDPAEDDHAEDAALPNRVSIEAIVTDIRANHASQRHTLTPTLRNRVIMVASILSFRDFVGIATISLISIYLQKAFGYTTQHAGFIVGGMMLISVIVNPLATFITAGQRRLPGLAIALVLGGLTLLSIPWLSVAWVLPIMSIFQSFQFASYAISDAALLERVAPQVRGRVVGLFLMLAGTFASLSPWAMGYWTDLLGARSADPHAYFPIFATLSCMMIAASIAPRWIARLTDAPEPAAPAVALPA